MNTSRLVPITAIAVLCAAASVVTLPAHAALSTYAAIDYGVLENQPHPKSNSAAAAFDAAAGVVQLIDFESSALGQFSVLSIASGVSIVSGFPASGGAPQAILSAPIDSQNNKTGYNTTVGGSKFVQMSGGSVTFNFTAPISGFGAYVTGVNNTAFFTFNDGTAQSIAFHSLFEVGIFGGTTFVGFIDSGKTITSVTITNANSLGVPDAAGVDDVRYVSAVPEPATGVLFGAGIILASISSRSQMRRQSRIFSSEA